MEIVKIAPIIRHFCLKFVPFADFPDRMIRLLFVFSKERDISTETTNSGGKVVLSESWDCGQ